MGNQHLQNQLASAARAIDNGLHNAEIAERLGRFGYTTEKLQEGWALYEQARQLYQEQEDRYGDQFGATDAFRQAWAEAEELYNQHLAIARMLFEDDRDAWQDLALEGKRPQAFARWLEAAMQFYENALAQPALLDRFAELGLTVEKLQEGKTRVEAAASAEHAQEVARGKAQEATRVRDEAFAALKVWMEDYLTVAKVALRDAPQLAEMLGILVRS